MMVGPVAIGALGWTALSLLGTALALAALLAWLRRKLTPQREAPLPTSRPDDPVPQSVRVPTAGGKTLHALWLPATPFAGGAPATVLLHGWGGNASHLWRAACTLHALGHAVLVPEARNHGQSDADSHSSLPRFAQDLHSALDWVRLQPGTDTHRLSAVGHSVGGAAVLLCATQRKDLQGVVSVSAFDHPEDVMRRWLRAHHIPYVPLGWLVNRWVEWVIGHRFNRIAPLNNIARAHCPVLLVHGEQDDVVPVSCAHRLWQAGQTAHTDRTTLLLVPGRHDSFDDEDDLMRRVALWLSSQPPCGVSRA